MLLALVALAATPLYADTGPMDDNGIHFVIDLDQPQVASVDLAIAEFNFQTPFQALDFTYAIDVSIDDSGGLADHLGKAILNSELGASEFEQHYKHEERTSLGITEAEKGNILKVPWRMSHI